MLKNLKSIIENNFNFRLNKNQLRDIERLMFEIMRRQNSSLEEIISSLKKLVKIKKASGKSNFFILREELIRRRFPLTSKQQNIDVQEVFLNNVPLPLAQKWLVKEEFLPLTIFAEKSVQNSLLLRNFQKHYPKTPIKILNHYTDYLKTNKFTLAELKKPLVFIIKEKWDFLKPCPCTKYHLRCGYWIFNIGFGCPYDCSYCFLQQYSNFPGVILPANLEDFFEKFDDFSEKMNLPVRIGTGEFSDSLALDEITEYSKSLIPYFKKKNVFFELKTKSAQIQNILNIEPSDNIIISWSLNPQEIIQTEEKGAPSLLERLKAAKLVQEKGYRIGFHFDPIIPFTNWENLYKNTIDLLYSYLKTPFAWISLGTLRCNRRLKTIAELRTPKTNIFYTELLKGEDKKLRYPKFIRKNIYSTMMKYLRKYDTKTPVYLCMEDKDIWGTLGENFDNTSEIEKYILNIKK